MIKKFLTPLLLSLAAVAAAVSLGSVAVPLTQVWGIAAHKLLGTPLAADVGVSAVAIVWNIRLPRVLTAFLAGAALAAGGTVSQSVLRNPLASPYTLGVSAGAALGAGLVIISGLSFAWLGLYTLPIAGLLGGLIAVAAAVLFAARVDRSLSTNTLILSGMVFSLFINAVLTLLTVLYRQNLEEIVRWQMGSFAGRGFGHVLGLAAFCLPCLFALLFFIRELDLMTFGEEQAQAAGVHTGRVKWILLAITAVMTGSAVAFSGIVGFIDLIAPHVVRRMYGSAHRAVLPLSMVFGGVFMVLADLLARLLAQPSELPVGVISALAGAPFFVYVYFRRAKG